MVKICVIVPIIYFLRKVSKLMKDEFLPSQTDKSILKEVSINQYKAI